MPPLSIFELIEEEVNFQVCILSDDDEGSIHRLHSGHYRARDSEKDSDSANDLHTRGWHWCKKHLPILYFVYDSFQEDLDYQRYFLADMSSYYDEEVGQSVAQWAKHLQVQMKSQQYNSFDLILISIISFLDLSDLAWNPSGLPEKTLCSFFLLTMRHFAAPHQTPTMHSTRAPTNVKNGTVTWYCDSVNYVLQMHRAEDVIAETDFNVRVFTDLLKSHLQYMPKRYGIGLYHATVSMMIMFRKHNS